MMCLRPGVGPVVLLLVCTGLALAQPAPAPAPKSSVPATAPLELGRPVPLPSPSPSNPLMYVPPPPNPPPAPVVAPGLDPGPDGWGPFGPGSATPGWFFDTEVAVVFPAIKFRLTNDQPLPITGLQLHVPDVSLNTTVMPTFEIGYRLPDSCGLFALSYSFLLSEGTGLRSTDQGEFNVRTRLNINWVDLDYGTTPYEFAPRWDISWRLGVRLADVYFDSQASNEAMTQSASNDFLGAGPYARFDLERRIIPVPGLSVFGRAGGAVLVGRIRQRFGVTLDGINDSATVRRTQSVPYVQAQAGLAYVPEALPGLKLSAGYLFEDYFNVGRLGQDGQGETSQSRGEVWSHGAFLRVQFDF